MIKLLVLWCIGISFSVVKCYLLTRNRAAAGSSGADSGYGGQGGRMSPQNFLPPSSAQFNNSVSGDIFKLYVSWLHRDRVPLLV